MPLERTVPGPHALRRYRPLARPAEATACRAPGGVCREHANCCSSLCGAKDATGRRRCACPAPTVACGERCVDPGTAFLSDTDNCGGCGNRCPGAPNRPATCADGVCGLAPCPSGAFCLTSPTIGQQVCCPASDCGCVAGACVCPCPSGLVCSATAGEARCCPSADCVCAARSVGCDCV